MANVLQPTIDFHPRPVSHAPSPLGFGFGLSSAGPSSISSPTWASYQSQPGHTNPSAFHQLASSITQSASSRPQKRRLDPEDDSENSKCSAHRDESMDRSPTPPKRPAHKRARVTSPPASTSKDDAKEKKEEDNVDIGVLLGSESLCAVETVAYISVSLLASLPPQSLLPILTGLLKMQPNLKSVILPLIPRPAIEDAFEALKQSVKKLHDAIPFSNAHPYSTHYTFGTPQPVMRNDYILGRLRPHILDFVALCLSYFSYFSYKYPASTSTTKDTSTVQSNFTFQKDKFQPAETFAFLSTVTKLIIDQPVLVLSELEPLILPRLSEEWKLWIENLDRHANREGNIVAPSISRTWEVEIEKLDDGKAPGISRLMRDVAQHFPLKQGWGIPFRFDSV